MDRVAQLQETLDNHTERATRIEGELSQLATDEAAAREAAIRRDPSKRSDAAGITSEVGKIQRKQADRQRELAGLKLEMEAVRGVLADERKRTGQEALREKIATAQTYRLSELDRWNDLIACFGAFGDAWFAYAQLMAESDQFSVVTSSSGLVDANPELRDEWLHAARPVVQPVPTDFVSVFMLLREASADPSGMGTRQEDGIRTAGRSLPGMIDARPELNARLGLQDIDVDRRRWDGPKPHEDLVRPATESPGSEASWALTEELFGTAA
jgi:hypothetical protein